MVNKLTDSQIEEIVKSVIDPEYIFSIYNDDRNTTIWVQNMDMDKINRCKKILEEILAPLLFQPYTIFIDTKPKDSDF